MASTIERALKIALEAHEDQTDRYGAPYILHPLRVMSRLSDEKEKIVAILHDVIEDSEYTGKILLEKGFDPLIVSTVEALSKNPGEDYMDYIKRTTLNVISVRVKLADLADNMDLSRCAEVTTDDLSRFNRYLKAEKFLNGHLKNLSLKENRGIS